MKYLLYFSVLVISSITMGQESLLLGELRTDEIKPSRIDEKFNKCLIIGYKYKKKGNHKDSTIVGIEDYSKKGELVCRTTFSGKKNRDSYKKTYHYDRQGNVIGYEYLITRGGTVLGQTVDFTYDHANQLSSQTISLATIRYSYYPDGRLLYKSYFYNNRAQEDSEPWKIYFEYDEKNNLIHADTDTTGNLQTSFYNDKNELIQHDYYPGVAFSTYKYNDNKNCIRQVDYERGRKDWDSTVFIFAYDNRGNLIQSSSSGKNGKIYLDRQWEYNSDGMLVSEIAYVKNKARKIYFYYYVEAKE